MKSLLCCAGFGFVIGAWISSGNHFDIFVGIPLALIGILICCLAYRIENKQL